MKALTFAAAIAGIAGLVGCAPSSGSRGSAPASSTTPASTTTAPPAPPASSPPTPAPPAPAPPAPAPPAPAPPPAVKPIAPLALPSGPAGGPRAEGVDVSVYQSTIDWAKVKGAGVSFGIARASDGVHTIDSTFAANWSGMKAQGLVRGVYQFFRPSQSAVAQADLLASQVGKIGPGDLPPVCDVEILDGQTGAAVRDQVAAWCAEVEKKLGVTPMIYTSPGFWSSIGSSTSFWADDLWVAHWGVATPTIPASWKDYTFWQYSDTGKVSGIPSVVDRDRFHGTEKALRAYAGENVGDDYCRGLAVDSTGQGFWTVTLDGSVTAFGDATFRGSAGGKTFAQPVLGIVRTPRGLGYWIFAADGSVLAFGDATAAGDLAGQTLAAPIVGMAATPSGKGYWLAARDGSVHAFGDAPVLAAAPPSLSVVVGVAATPSGKGYWLAFADGEVAACGDAPALGGASAPLGGPVTAIAGTPSGQGYWLAQADGSVIALGDAAKMLYAGARSTRAPVVAISATLDGKGYWLVAGDGTILPVGDAVDPGQRAR